MIKIFYLIKKIYYKFINFKKKNPKQTEIKINTQIKQKIERDNENLLAQIFSPKQRELFYKKLAGEQLSKTEREYFSRVVKKKVLVLANSQLHHLAQKLLK